ncbi:hypothetical protein Tco_0852307 [Tanacetum coccineum]
MRFTMCFRKFQWIGFAMRRLMKADGVGSGGETLEWRMLVGSRNHWVKVMLMMVDDLETLKWKTPMEAMIGMVVDDE